MEVAGSMNNNGLKGGPSKALPSPDANHNFASQLSHFHDACEDEEELSRLGGSEDEEQMSNASSLESLDGPSRLDDEDGGSSTSCSVDSFEITSPFSTLDHPPKRVTHCIREVAEPEDEELVGPVAELSLSSPSTSALPSSDSGLPRADSGLPSSAEGTYDPAKWSGGSRAAFREPSGAGELGKAAARSPGEREKDSGVSEEDSDAPMHTPLSSSRRSSAGFEAALASRRSSKQSEDGSSEASGCQPSSRRGSKQFPLAIFDAAPASFDLDSSESRSVDSAGKAGAEKGALLSPTSPSAASSASSLRRSQVRVSIEEELSKLDTALPALDFGRLEAQLRLESASSTLREEVRRRLADEPSPPQRADPAARPTRSTRPKLATRLRNSKNMQICYMNESVGLAGEAGETEESSDSSDDEAAGPSVAFPKSSSTPNINRHRTNGVVRSLSSASDSLTTATRPAGQRITAAQALRARLEVEARTLLGRAEADARAAMAAERASLASPPPLSVRVPDSPFTSPHSTPSPSNDGDSPRRCRPVPRAPRVVRSQLSRLRVSELGQLAAELSERVAAENAALVELLVDRDALHMRQDSILVDVQDLLKSQGADPLNFPSLFVSGPAAKKPKSRRITSLRSLLRR